MTSDEIQVYSILAIFFPGNLTSIAHDIASSWLDFHVVFNMCPETEDNVGSNFKISPGHQFLKRLRLNTHVWSPSNAFWICWSTAVGNRGVVTIFVIMDHNATSQPVI